MNINRTNWIRILVVVFTALSITAANAEDQQVLSPLLIDLPGWEAGDAEGMSMDMGTVKMTNATRNYTREDSNITAMVMVGSHTMTQGQMQEMNAETTDAKVSISEMNGFKVYVGHDKNENSGSVTVFLSQGQSESSLFVVSYENLSEEEAVDLAKKFDWNRMKEVVDTLL